ncbi:MAG: hypothetical protein NZ570_04630 [Candidatus Caldarchaeum sp.]|nr:hypothetical protein [Candidatus Caldarchaeum sp.]MDW7977264.1 hypothetical protein [Candidatus Caldarchaeum sp.]MDW8359871.1 hypothetical protein [Candidatus Caldarchaeum sp.]
MSEEELEKTILQRCGDLSKQELDRLIESKLRTSPFLTRLGALLIVLEERNLLDDFPKEKSAERYEFTRISSLTSGLKSVSVVGRVLGFRRFLTSDNRPFWRIRLWDGTGAVDVLVWSDVENLGEISFGDAVAVWNGYVSSPTADRPFVLNAGSRSRVEKLSFCENLPDLDFSRLRLAEDFTAGPRTVDFSAVVVLNTGARRKKDDVKCLELVVSDGFREVLFTAWREWADALANVSEGTRFVAASAEVKGDELQTGFGTIITVMDQDREVFEKALSRSFDKLFLKIVGVGLDGLLVATDGADLKKLVAPEAGAGVDVIVERAFVIYRRGVPHIYGKSFQHAEKHLKTPEFQGSLDEVDGRHHAGLVRCRVLRKTPLAEMATRYGLKKVVSLWVEHMGKTYACSAWGAAAERIDGVGPGEEISLAFIKVKRNNYGEVELSIDGHSYIDA